MIDNALMILETGNPQELFVMNGLDAFINKIKEEVANAPQDISTEKGRKEIASLAYKVAKAKTALVKLGKESVEELRKTVDAVTKERNRGEKELQDLQDFIRKPLTDWENAEKERVARHEANISEIANAGEYTSLNWQSLSLEVMQERFNEIEKDANIDWQEFNFRASEVIMIALKKIKEAIEKRTNYDAEQAELKRLREEAATREQKEREERIAKEAAEKARLEAEAKARVETERAEREKQEAIARAEKAEADRIAAEKKAEQDRLSAIEAEKKRQAYEAAKIAAETAKREADMAHKKKINNEALKAIGALPNMNEGIAKSIVEAIAKGLIPHVKINY